MFADAVRLKHEVAKRRRLAGFWDADCHLILTVAMATPTRLSPKALSIPDPFVRTQRPMQMEKGAERIIICISHPDPNAFPNSHGPKASNSAPQIQNIHLQPCSAPHTRCNESLNPKP